MLPPAWLERPDGFHRSLQSPKRPCGTSLLAHESGRFSSISASFFFFFSVFLIATASLAYHKHVMLITGYLAYLSITFLCVFAAFLPRLFF
jgi:hypothetical protein